MKPAREYVVQLKDSKAPANIWQDVYISADRADAEAWGTNLVESDALGCPIRFIERTVQVLSTHMPSHQLRSRSTRRTTSRIDPTSGPRQERTSSRSAS